MSQLRSVRLRLIARPAWAARSWSTLRMERTRFSKVEAGAFPVGSLALLMSGSPSLSAVRQRERRTRRSFPTES